MDNRERKRLRTIGHQLHPVVTVAGNGLNENVLAELNRALDDHELIKVRLVAEDKAERLSMLAAIETATTAERVQLTGGIALILRPARKPKAHLSNLVRHGIL